MPASAEAVRRRALGVPAPLWIVAGAISTQLASALAVHAFRQIGPVGLAFGRIAFAAAVLAVVIGIPHVDAASRRVVAVFGVALAAMNTCFYLGIDRIPIGPAVTLEFWGPIAVAVATTRRRADLVWVALALLGVGLLGGGFGGSQPAGVAWCLLAGGCWAVYIVAGRRVAARFSGASGLAPAMVVGAVALAPFGIAAAGRELLEPQSLFYCLVVGVMASAIPYGLEQGAMRRVPARTFSVLLALHPAVAAVIGAVVLDQGLSPVDVAAIGLVAVAAAGSMGSAAGEMPLGEP
jgi:inner membrane transporter RhtA